MLSYLIYAIMPCACLGKHDILACTLDNPTIMIMINYHSCIQLLKDLL